MGTLSYRNGTAVLRVYVGTDPGTGKPRRRSVSYAAANKREAWRLKPKYEAQLLAERDALAEMRGTVGELVGDWLEIARRDRSPSTLPAYERHAARIVKRFGTTALDRLTVRDVDAWYSSLIAGGMTPANLRHVHRVLSAVLQFGYRKGRAPDPVTKRVTLPAHTPKEIRPPSNDVVRRMFHELPDVPWGRAVALLASTGMRRGEVVGLRWDDIDDMAGTITVRHSVVELPGGGLVLKDPKGKRARTFKASGAALAILAKQPREGVYVFGDDEPARPGWVSLMWGRWRDAHGAKGVRLHDLRHWYATQALEGGAPIPSVSRQLGHAQVSTTLNVYGHGTDSGEQMATAAIDAALRREDET